MLNLMLTLGGLIIFIIPISLIYRLYIFLRYGYNPEVTLNTLLPKRLNEFNWKGIEYLYVSVPIEIILLTVLFFLVVLTDWLEGRNRQKYLKS